MPALLFRGQGFGEGGKQAGFPHSDSPAFPNRPAMPAIDHNNHNHNSGVVDTSSSFSAATGTLPWNATLHPQPQHHHQQQQQQQSTNAGRASNVVIVTDLHPALFQDPVEKRRLEAWMCGEFGEFLVAPAWLRSFHRLIVVFRDAANARRAKAGLDFAIWHGTPIRAYLGDYSVDGDAVDWNQHLAPPPNQRTFLLSPPPSPPVDWEQRVESAPVPSHVWSSHPEPSTALVSSSVGRVQSAEHTQTLLQALVDKFPALLTMGTWATENHTLQSPSPAAADSVSTVLIEPPTMEVVAHDAADSALPVITLSDWDGLVSSVPMVQPGGSAGLTPGLGMSGRIPRTRRPDDAS